MTEIIAKYNLKEENNSDYLEPYNKYFNEFPWWNANERKESKYYMQIDDKNEVGYQLWYDEKTQNRYYQPILRSQAAQSSGQTRISGTASSTPSPRP